MTRTIRRKSTSAWLIVLLAIVGSAAIGGLFIFPLWLLIDIQSDNHNARRQRASEKERRDAIRAAFTGPPQEADPQLKQQVQAFFDRMGKDWSNGESGKVSWQFDFERVLDEFDKRVGQLPLDGFERRAAAAKQRTDFASKLAKEDGWQQTIIKRIDSLPNGEALVYARHIDHRTAYSFPMRWWLTSNGVGWRAYDFEYLDTDMRDSDLRAIPADDPMFGGPEWDNHVNAIFDARLEITKNNLENAEALLKKVRDVEFPAKLDAVRWLQHTALAERRAKYAEAHAHLDNAERLNPGMAAIFIHRAFLFNQDSEYEKALEEVKKYTDFLGEDTDICFELGFALAGLGRKNEAAAAFRRLLNLSSQSTNAITQFRRNLPKDKKRAIGGYLLKLKDLQNNYAKLAKDAAQDFDGEGLYALAAAYRTKFANDGEAIFDQARALGMQRKYTKALPLYQLALKKEINKERRKQMLERMLMDSVDGRIAIEGYKAAPDAKQAFQFLANDILGLPDYSSLRSLVAAHRLKHPADPLLHFYDGELAINARQLAVAEKHFAKIDLKKIAPSQRKRMIGRFAFIYHDLNKGVAAYRKTPFAKEFFQQLAQIYARQKEAKNLKELIRLHRAKHPGDDNLKIWEAEVLWLEKKHAALVKLLTADRTVLDLKLHAYKMYDRLFESLYALNRRASAVREIHRLVSLGTPDSWTRLRSVFSSLYRRKQKQQAAHFAGAVFAKAPDEPEACMIAARANILQKKFSEAAAQFHKAWDRQGQNWQQRTYQRTFLLAHVDAGKPLVGYRAARDVRAAFGLLATELSWRKELETLRTLIETHKKNDVDDVWLLFWQGELALLENRFRAAELLFADGAGHVANKYEKDRFVRKLNEARLHEHGAAAAYEKGRPSLTLFTNLAYVCERTKKPKQLQKLINVHRKHFPNDNALPLWEMDVHWLAQDYHKTVAALRGKQEQILANRNNYWKYADRLIRSLVRLKKFKEAQTELSEAEKRGRPSLILYAVVAAASGDVKATTAALQRCKKGYILERTFYNDPDLGPALRSAAFRALRKRYPEPKDQKQ